MTPRFERYRDQHPAFYGSFDWHSCVEMHWVAVRLLHLFPEETAETGARAIISGLLTPENLAIERAFFDQPFHGSWERPYGWGWYLTLSAELATWDDPDARRWLAALQPLASYFEDGLLAWLPKLTYAVRHGVHANTAFSLSLAYRYAMQRADQGDRRLQDAIDASAIGWFVADVDAPVAWEPSGTDFLSGILTEAELMSRVLPWRSIRSLVRCLSPRGRRVHYGIRAGVRIGSIRWIDRPSARSQFESRLGNDRDSRAPSGGRPTGSGAARFRRTARPGRAPPRHRQRLHGRTLAGGLRGAAVELKGKSEK